MKIAIISDIHGNNEALSSVLKDIEKQNIKTIFVCGDLAMAGPEPALTLENIMKLSNDYKTEVIQGNTDEMIVKYSGKENDPYLPPNEIMAEALKYAKKTLSQSQRNYLEALPAQKSLKIGEVSILLVHGSPRKNNEDIMPAQPIEKIKEMIKNTTEDIIFCGHTHLPAGYQVEKQTIVNVGSVGRPFTDEPQACYVVLNIPDLNQKGFEIEHRLIDYDFKTASQKLAQLNFKGADKLAAMLIKATSRYPQ